ncbi:MAG: sugar phosphate isomerase/epimerase [Lentisphaeria bacterium]|nr:sugar phosphate isomerase/epimerase [Lentisphaeria bacterium]
MVPEISVQLYSVREQAAANYEGTIRAIADMGFINVEPAGFPGSTPELAAKLFKELGLKAPSCHGALPIGDDKNKIIETAQLLGHKYIITGCPPDFQKNFESIDSVKEVAELYSEAAAFAAQYDIQVGYHNHDWDLKEVNGKRLYQVFLENTPESVLWEADLFWVTKAGLNPAEFVKEIGVRGKCLHFKDGFISNDDTFIEKETADGKIMVSGSKPFMPAGTGVVDLLGAAKVYDHTEIVAVELDSYVGDMMQAVQESYTYLTSNGIAKGNK